MTQALPPRSRHFHHSPFDARTLAAAKGNATNSVCMPARDEATTVAAK